MALSARPTSAPTTPSIPSGHSSSGGRGVASVPYAQVEELSAKTGVQPDANSNFLGFDDWRGKRRPEQEVAHASAENFSTTTATFLSLVNQEQSAAAAQSANGVKGAFMGLLSKAIRAYEGTAVVINGAATPRGSSLSLSL